MDSRFEAFTVLIAKASRCIYKIKTGKMAQYNLKSSHVSCLYYLYKADSLTAKELCDLCGEDKANISRAVKYLESEGYISCPSTAQKRYQSALVLTQKGKSVGKDITEEIDKILRESGKGISEENRKIFYQSLALICENLEQICTQYGE